ncbi:FAD-dependent oxidoreductase [Candidatus Roizmanbacteria bacterium]|nr:FAD-dependent oxidoreductase [Candidatus Roizmanbacteria bacterium]
MQTYRTTLTKKTVFPHDVDLFHFSLNSPETIIFTPGQYIILKVPAEKGFVNRLYSIASASTQADSFELLIKRVPGGLASNYINTFVVGQKVEFCGPAGQFSLKNTPLTKVFLTTGTGIAPIRSFILSNKDPAQSYHLFWGMSFAADLYLLDELKEFAKNAPHFKFTVCLSKEPSLEKIDEADRVFFSLGHVNEAALGLINSLPQNSLEFYICGRREVVESLREYLYTHGIDRSLVYFERY